MRWVISGLAAIVAIGGEALAEEAPAARPASIIFTELLERLPKGDTYAFLERGLNCDGYRQLRADGVTSDITGTVRSKLNRELEDYGFNIAMPTGSDFSGGLKRVYELKGVVTRRTTRACARRNTVETRTSIEIEWKVYSVGSRDAALKITTQAQRSASYDVRDGMDDIADGKLFAIDRAVADNLRELASHPNLRKLITTRPDPEALLPAADLKRISAPAPAAASPNRTVAQAAGGVVLIVVDGGHGSGALVSTDGYILTNAHVVGEAKAVKVRWPDGVETSGQVVQVHAGRDVALIRTDAKGHPPLEVRTGPLELGEPVMAIGAPLDEGLQGTVTRGIVSTPVRKFQGFNFIQSDVSVTFGNSGGALIDDQRRLIGLTDIGYRPELSGNSLNLFIPIKEALDYTGLDLVVPAPPAPPVQPAAAKGRQPVKAAVRKR